MPGFVQFEQWVPVPTEAVFAFFSDPRNLVHLMPPARRCQIDTLVLVPAPSGAPSAAAGTELTVSFRPLPPLPFRTRWIARIEAVQAGRSFEDVQVSGPFRSWRHRHEFEPHHAQAGTVLRDVVAFDPGWGFLGRLLEHWIVAPEVRRTFHHRQQALLGLLAGT
jgi:ligand-binding SRPBCC domain-containing protein